MISKIGGVVVVARKPNRECEIPSSFSVDRATRGSGDQLAKRASRSNMFIEALEGSCSYLGGRSPFDVKRGTRVEHVAYDRSVEHSLVVSTR
jgi:hypothetical protein